MTIILELPVIQYTTTNNNSNNNNKAWHKLAQFFETQYIYM